MATTVSVSNTTEATVVGNKLIKKHDTVGSINSTDHSEFVARLGQIDETLASAVASGTVKLVDSIIYSAKVLSGSTTVELMESADQKKVGLRNLNKRQLEANTYFLVTGIQLLMTSTLDSDNENPVPSSEYTYISSLIANGELEIKQGDKIIFPRNSCEIFLTDGPDRKPYKGMYRLECPKMLIPLTDIVPTIWLPSGETIPTVGLKIVFHGVRTNG